MPAPSRSFGHPPDLIREWRERARRALRMGARTPFHLGAAGPYAHALQRLEVLDLGRPMRLWLSAKTQPLPPLWRWWRQQGGGIEVVSEFEFRAALAEGYDRSEILVNGPAKQRWLPELGSPGLRVNFDSPRELGALLPLARAQKWRIGLRLRTLGETDPEFPEFATQFGFELDEAATALRRLARAGLSAETVHFHLRTNIATAGIYAEAVQTVVEFCAHTGWKPRYLDVGGGLPPPFTQERNGRRFDADLRLPEYAAALRQAVESLPDLDEVWLEHGRFLSAGSGVLVVRVLDLKERSGARILICDGGRTLNALVSTWEDHEVQPLERRSGRQVLTAVHGPTCMAFDCLGRRPLPASLRPGDHLLWFEAGAYHLSWETRFSHGLSEVWWEDEQGLRRVRAGESFEQFWSAWKQVAELPPNSGARKSARLR